MMWNDCTNNQRVSPKFELFNLLIFLSSIYEPNIKTPSVIINLMLNANRGDIESRTILIAMKLEPTVTDKVIISTQSLNWFKNIHTLL
jgi:hypothetical protein